MSSSLSDLSSAPTLGASSRRQPRKDKGGSHSFSGFDIDESLYEPTARKPSASVPALGQQAAHDPLADILGPSSGTGF